MVSTLGSPYLGKLPNTALQLRLTCVFPRLRASLLGVPLMESYGILWSKLGLGGSGPELQGAGFAAWSEALQWDSNGYCKISGLQRGVQKLCQDPWEGVP